MQKICIVIPCFNEEHRLNLELFENFFKQKSFCNVCFVNDGSTDDTQRILENLKLKIGNNCSVINMKQNKGKAEAVRTGVLNNIAKDFDYIGFFDADLSTPLKQIDVFIEHINSSLELDILMGTRFNHLGATIKRSKFRHYFGRIFSTIASLILKLNVYDTQCGAKLYSKKCYTKIFSNTFKSKWLFDIELLFRYMEVFGRESAKKLIREIPLTSWIEKKNSKLKLNDFIRIPADLFIVWFFYRNKN
ncbi:MAG: glycosyltransferase [Flavobacteriales bacterium]|nr:MAG: glycosyltransferase [Flavobacteriales bacterium]|tara:strand:- start:414 stop:1154 length:741 start_codon:yes stop_codon:yes gene_type:complete